MIVAGTILREFQIELNTKKKKKKIPITSQINVSTIHKYLNWFSNFDFLISGWQLLVMFQKTNSEHVVLHDDFVSTQLDTRRCANIFLAYFVFFSFFFSPCKVNRVQIITKYLPSIFFFYFIGNFTYTKWRTI